MPNYWISSLFEEPLLGGDASRLLVETPTEAMPSFGPVIICALELDLVDQELPKGLTQRVKRAWSDNAHLEHVSRAPDFVTRGVKFWIIARGTSPAS
ncbi:MAG TPA: hypothetical protein VK961_26910 [Chthoniobacter sp.]|nr:hypothetical protein [Chthoniobacter sp.]